MKRGMVAGLVFAFLVALSPGASAQVTPEKVAQSIQEGVKYLISKQEAGGMWRYSGSPLPHEAKGSAGDIGTTALVGLTLLEVGDLNDSDLRKRIRRAAEMVHREERMTFTYSMSTSIWFLDKLIEKADELRTKGENAAATELSSDPERDGKLLLKLADRVRRGCHNGGWTYNTEEGKADVHTESDNSNTQFAVLALWIARRHGFNGDAEIRAAEARFRNHQDKGDGGWPYLKGEGNPSTPAMTCSGLIGLAVGHGITLKKRTTTFKAGGKPDAGGPPPAARGPLIGKDNEIKDKDIKRGMAYLADHLGDASVLNSAYGLYGLWSVERVARIYNLAEINGKDWYSYGANVILRTQGAEGNWSGAYAGNVDTCFALLFLSKVNLASDLTNALRGDTLTTDPNKATSKAATGAPEAKPVEKPEVTQAQTAADIVSQIIKGKDSKTQIALLTILKETKGKEYTDAFLEVIPKLSSTMQQRAREMFAERLARMTPAQLRAYMEKDRPPELRRAAASASGLKGDTDLLIDLMMLQKDKDADVAGAAREAHARLSGKGSGGR